MPPARSWKLSGRLCGSQAAIAAPPRYPGLESQQPRTQAGCHNRRHRQWTHDGPFNQQQQQPQRQSHEAGARSRVHMHTPGTTGTRRHLPAGEIIT